MVCLTMHSEHFYLGLYGISFNDHIDNREETGC